jgi:hypothetical protein
MPSISRVLIKLNVLYLARAEIEAAHAAVRELGDMLSRIVHSDDIARGLVGSVDGNRITFLGD